MVKNRKRRVQALPEEKPRGYLLVVIAIILSLIGLVFVFEASSIRALQAFGDSFYYLKLQIRWLVLGSVAMWFFSTISYRRLFHFGFPILIGTYVLLLLVLIPGIGSRIGGTRGWIDLGLINIQPSEIARLALILYLSSWFSKKEFSFLGFAVILGSIIGLLLLQPDLGAAIIIGTLGMALYILAGKNVKSLILFIPVGALGLIGLIMAAPYRLRRIAAFLDPSQDPLGVGFHVNQILISLSEGGMLGRGFGASRQKYLFLPEAHTDSIFAIIGEELGFAGSFILIMLYAFFLYKLYQLYNAVADQYGKLLIGGIFVYFAMQIMVNLGGMVNIIPLTGVTLPFISYGGSSMIISFIFLGIALNIAKTAKKP